MMQLRGLSDSAGLGTCSLFLGLEGVRIRMEPPQDACGVHLKAYLEVQASSWTLVSLWLGLCETVTKT